MQMNIRLCAAMIAALSLAACEGMAGSQYADIDDDPQMQAINASLPHPPPQPVLQTMVRTLQAPRILPRVIKLPEEIAGKPNCFIFLSSMLHAHIGELFSGMAIKGFYQFRLTRNSELTVEEDELKNLRTALQGELRHRQYGDAVRLEVSAGCSHLLSDLLLGQLAGW